MFGFDSPDVQKIGKDNGLAFVSFGLVGPKGTDGAPAEGFSGVAGAPINANRVVKYNASGQFVYASNDQVGDVTLCIGLSTSAALGGEAVTGLRVGEVTDNTWTWTPGQNVFVGVNGELTQTPPTAPAAKFIQVIGIAATATKIFLTFQSPIML